MKSQPVKRKRYTFEEMEMRAVVPPPGEWVRTTVTLPAKTIAVLEAALKEVNSTRPFPDRMTRDDLIALYVDWADTERREQAKLK